MAAEKNSPNPLHGADMAAVIQQRTAAPGPVQDSATLAAELDALENHNNQDVAALLTRATQAASVADLIGNAELGHRARLVEADMQRRQGDVGEASRTILQIHRWAVQHRNRLLIARSHFHLALTYHYLGDSSTSLEHALSAVENLEDGAPPGVRIVYLIRLANTLAENGSPDAARERYRQAERIAADIGDLPRQLLVLNNLAYTELEAGNADVALAAVDRIYATARTIGRDLLIIERDTVANIYSELGRFADAEVLLRDLHDAPPWFEAHDGAEAALTLAVAERNLGLLDRARSSLELCIRLCDEQELAGVRLRALAEQAELYAAVGDYHSAFAEFKRFHAESERLRSAQAEARARARHAMFETAEARRDAERYREQARRDPLTGLWNRRYVGERLPQLLATGVPTTIALVDLDHFKRINDTLSHDVGDEVLVAVADLLGGATDELAADGFAARMGGEEFLLVLPGVEPAALELIRARIADHRWERITGALPVTASIGAVTSTEGPDDLLAEADRRLYAAKHGGRNQVMFDHPLNG